MVMTAQEERPTYQLQYRRCGRANCHVCKQGQGHGPYWYAYGRDATGKLRSRYVGHAPPADAALSPLQQERWEQAKRERVAARAQGRSKPRMRNGRITTYGQ
jgi:hypothetical protein